MYACDVTLVHKGLFQLQGMLWNLQITVPGPLWLIRLGTMYQTYCIRFLMELQKEMEVKKYSVYWFNLESCNL